MTRVWSAALTLMSSTTVATLTILVGVFLKWLLSLAVQPDAPIHTAATFALDAIYVPCAVLWAASGVWVVVREAWDSFKPSTEQAGT